MIKRRNELLLITAATLNLSACGYIQSLFPDKEKDYQFTTEIPPLVLPQDLSKGAAGKAAEARPEPETERIKEENQQSAGRGETEGTPENTESMGETGTEEQSEQVPQSEETDQAVQQEQPEQKPEADAVEEKKDDKTEGTPVELVRFSDGERRLRIDSSPNRAWHLVSKALSRNSIEVTRRDQDQKLFYVQYDPDAKKAEDGSLLDEAVFLFKGFEANEKEYLLKLIPVDDKADLAVTDKDLNPVPDDDAAVKLLRLLGGTIQGN
jgi:outer membrane protein assembly factor BamC